MRTPDLLKRIDELLQQGQMTLETRHAGQIQDGVDRAAMAGFRAGALSFIERVYGNNHTHFHEFNSKASVSTPGDASRGIAILQTIRAEIAGGWLFTIKSLVTAEVFADFLEMAEHLLSSGYKDPAAVMAGSVLEEHLRQLCSRFRVEVSEERDGKMTPKKADRINSDLAKVDAYNKLDQKQITAWLDLRNSAAHGKYDAYSADQVGRLISGITEFMARVTL